MGRERQRIAGGVFVVRVVESSASSRAFGCIRRIECLASLLLTFVFSVVLSGCGAGVMLAPTAGLSGTRNISGSVHGGQQPVAGASVYLYAVGVTGYGSAAKSLLNNPVSTDAYGNFTITSDYSCPTTGTAFGPSTPVYILVAGGNPGLSAGTNNSALLMMSPLGPCNTLTSSTFVNVDEVSTVGAVWALAPFLSSGGNVGASAANQQGIANAFATAANLVNPSTGYAPGANAPFNASIPVQKVYSLANLLSACVNSDGTAVCNQIFTAATPPGGTAPTNTLDAALDIVRNPANKVSGLFNLITGIVPFQPGLSSPPADWTMTVNFNAGGINQPTAVSIDASGDVWVANYNNVVSEYSPQGLPLVTNGYSSGGLNENYGMSIDPSGNVWITNQASQGGVNGGQGSVTELSGANGAALSGSYGFTAGGIDYPVAVTPDTNGNIWIANYANSTVTLFQHPGSGINAVNVSSGAKMYFPNAIAIDAGHNAWVSNQSIPAVTRISEDTTQVTTYTCCNAPDGIAVDQSGNVWVSNYGGSSISELSNAGTVLLNQETGGGLAGPQGIAIDGAGNIWVANSRTSQGGLSEFSGANSTVPGTALSPSTGLGADASMKAPYSVAIDGSGNLWVSNLNGGNMTEFVGLATPVATPTVGPPKLP